MSDDVQLDADRWRFRGGRRSDDLARGPIGRVARFGSESNSHSTSRQIDLAPKEYKKQRGFVADTLHSLVAGRGPTIDGPFVSPITADETAALGQYRANEFDPGGLGAAADANLKATLGPQEDNPFLNAAITAATRPLVQNAQLQELRDRANFTASGQKIQGSSAFQENRNNAVRDTERNVGDIAATLAFQERTNQLQAVNLANARLSEQREGITALALPRLISQLGIDKANAEIQRRFEVMQQALNALANLTQPSMSQRSNSWSQSTSGGVSGGGGDSGGGGAGGVAGAGK